MHEGGIATPLGGTKPQKPIGPIVGAGIIVIVLALGGLYFWGAALNKKEAAERERAAQEEEQPADLETDVSIPEAGSVEGELDTN